MVKCVCPSGKIKCIILHHSAEICINLPLPEGDFKDLSGNIVVTEWRIRSVPPP